LCAAPSENRPAHRPEAPGIEFQSDQKQQQHHAEFGKMQDVFDAADQAQPPGADGDTRHQVAQHRTQAESFGDRHRNHCSQQIHQRVQ
jgi:hypothetical protein